MNPEIEIKKIVEILQNGGTILYPTDTIWGIGCDATNEKAVEKIFRIKKRSESKSLIVLVADKIMLRNYVKIVPEIALKLIKETKKPLTIIYDQGINLAKNILAENGSVGIRIPNDEFCKNLILKFRKPIVSTSANMSGEPFPKNFSEIKDEIKNLVDYIVNLRKTEKNISFPSTIIKVKNSGEIQILRN